MLMCNHDDFDYTVHKFRGGEKHMDKLIIFKCIVSGYYAWRIKEEKTSLFVN